MTLNNLNIEEIQNKEQLRKLKDNLYKKKSKIDKQIKYIESFGYKVGDIVSSIETKESGKTANAIIPIYKEINKSLKKVGEFYFIDKIVFRENKTDEKTIVCCDLEDINILTISSNWNIEESNNYDIKGKYEGNSYNVKLQDNNKVLLNGENRGIRNSFTMLFDSKLKDRLFLTYITGKNKYGMEIELEQNGEIYSIKFIINKEQYKFKAESDRRNIIRVVTDYERLKNIIDIFKNKINVINNVAKINSINHLFMNSEVDYNNDISRIFDREEQQYINVK